MKCPKCGYLGFETTERCRHCGYDFSLSIQLDEGAAHALSLRSSGEREAPLADFDLRGLNTDIVSEPTTGLDLDRIVSHTETAAALATPPADDIQQQYPAPEPVDVASLPLFTGARAVPDEASPLAAPRRARPPLAVRRATPEVVRRRTPRMVRRDAEMALELDAPASSEHMPVEGPSRVRQPAPAARRVGAAIVDVVILGSINSAVLYLTLAIAGLPVADAGIIPLVPMAAFLMLLNGGYLVGFTAVHGQTIGKMVTRVRVVADNDEDVDIAGAVLRALGVTFSLVAAGLPYLPVLLSADRRALHDRLAGTRVIKDA
jgi:uncharacterized RDD family membrane protein YckC